MARYTPEQRRNIAEALRLTRRDRPKTRKSLLEAMAVEANFRHLHYGDRDSQGVLQQRPSQGWGAYIPGVRGVRQDINDYLSRARRLMRQGFKGTPGQLAQAVQRSAFPERYDQRAAEVNALLNRGNAFYGASAASPRDSDESFGLSPDAAGTTIKRNVSDHMMQQLSYIVDNGQPQSLSNFYALSKMMADSAGPDPNTEEKPPKTVSVGRGAGNEGAIMGGGVGAGGFFPLGKADYTYGGGMAAHGSRAIGNWQSDRAVDLMARAGTPVYATQAGIIKGGFGDSGSKGTVYGKRLSVYSKNNAFFYQHLGRYGPGIAPGRRVRKGQLLGYIGYFPGKPAPHLHYGVQRGNPFGILTGDRRRRR